MLTKACNECYKSLVPCARNRDWIKMATFLLQGKNEDKTGHKSLSVTVTSPNKSSLKGSV